MQIYHSSCPIITLGALNKIQCNCGDILLSYESKFCSSDPSLSENICLH